MTSGSCDDSGLGIYGDDEILDLDPARELRAGEQLPQLLVNGLQIVAEVILPIYSMRLKNTRDSMEDYE